MANRMLGRDWGSYTPPLMTSESMRNWGQLDLTPYDQNQLSVPNVDTSMLEQGASGIQGPGSWWDSINLMDKTNLKTGMKEQGTLSPMIQGASALMSGILGWKQFGLQKDALKQTKKEFDMNWGAQQKSVNSSLEDRQRARVASNPGAYQSVGEYMDKNRI